MLTRYGSISLPKTSKQPVETFRIFFDLCKAFSANFYFWPFIPFRQGMSRSELISFSDFPMFRNGLDSAIRRFFEMTLNPRKGTKTQMFFYKKVYFARNFYFQLRKTLKCEIWRFYLQICPSPPLFRGQKKPSIFQRRILRSHVPDVCTYYKYSRRALWY
mgnify:CR=1 FL=1